MQLDGSLDLFGTESLLLRDDHKVPRLLHDLLEELGDDVVDESYAFLRDAKLRLHLLQNTEDVELEGVRVCELQWLLDWSARALV